MANDVFANGREISCKSGDGKTICSMPDVCFTPPENPATPPGVPVPYPNTGFASETTEGSKTVKIGGKEVMLKDKSYFKSSTGDEAGCAAKKGVITSVNRGKVYFTSWSMDVKFEGENVVRHLDLTTNNHNPPPGNTPPWAHVETMTVQGHSCAKIIQKIHPYGEADCKSGSQSHHIVDNSNLTMRGARSVPLNGIEGGDTNGRKARNLFQPGDGCHPGENYDENDAPCVCLSGGKSNPKTQHGKAHKKSKEMALSRATADGKWTYADAREAGKESIQSALNLEDWEAECVGLALDAYYKKKLGCTNKTEMVAPTGTDFSATQFNNGKGKGKMCTCYELV